MIYILPHLNGCLLWCFFSRVWCFLIVIFSRHPFKFSYFFYWKISSLRLQYQNHEYFTAGRSTFMLISSTMRNGFTYTRLPVKTQQLLLEDLRLFFLGRRNAKGSVRTKCLVTPRDLLENCMSSTSWWELYPRLGDCSKSYDTWRLNYWLIHVVFPWI